MAAASSDYPEWSRRAEAAHRASVALTERVQSRRHALELIFAEHGVREAYLFGSVARGEGRPGSDVDIAVAGCPSASFYRLAAKLERALALPLDLVDLDGAPADFAEPIRHAGLRLYPIPPAQPANRSPEGRDEG
jgi:predicted nucleotidyltransferase